VGPVRGGAPAVYAFVCILGWELVLVVRIFLVVKYSTPM